MPIFIAALIGALAQAAVSIVGRVLLSLGFGLVVMTSVNASLEWIKTMIASAFGGLPAVAVGILSGAQVGTCLAIILSAISARLLFDGMSASGVIKRWAVK